MKTSENGINLIKKFEGCKLTPYLCPARILTVGYGHTGNIENRIYTQNEVEELLINDLIYFEKGIERLIISDINQNQFDALISFSFNLGLGALKSSTLRSKLNRGEYEFASNEFIKWNKSGGKILLGLTKRRVAERYLFLS